MIKEKTLNNGDEMKLPNGITGFYNSENKPPNVDGKHFNQVCVTALSRLGGEVLMFKEPKYPTNFYDAKVKLRNRIFHILLNEHYPYVAFASAVEYEKIRFIDDAELFKQLSPFYHVLLSSELNLHVILRQGSKKDILQNDNELNQAELEQIAYWKPKIIGEIIFNFWD